MGRIETFTHRWPTGMHDPETIILMEEIAEAHGWRRIGNSRFEGVSRLHLERDAAGRAKARRRRATVTMDAEFREIVRDYALTA